MRLRHEGHDIPLWSVPGCKKRSVYAGEAYASWLWLLLAPADTDVLTCELTALRDVRDRTDGASLPPPFGALSPSWPRSSSRWRSRRPDPGLRRRGPVLHRIAG
ncbi:DUF6758 family protein [Nocardiopsis composta]